MVILIPLKYIHTRRARSNGFSNKKKGLVIKHGKMKNKIINT